VVPHGIGREKSPYSHPGARTQIEPTPSDAMCSQVKATFEFCPSTRARQTAESGICRLALVCVLPWHADTSRSTAWHGVCMLSGLM
jgi:hypothetical protein